MVGQHTNAHAYTGKRVRHDVIDGAALLAFSLVTSCLLALALTGFLALFTG